MRAVLSRRVAPAQAVADDTPAVHTQGSPCDSGKKGETLLTRVPVNQNKTAMAAHLASTDARRHQIARSDLADPKSSVLIL